MNSNWFTCIFFCDSRDELVAKFLKDNTQFDDERAAMEVDKFMMDTVMVDKYIAFEKKKKSDLERGAEYFREEREKNFSDPSTIATYAAWIAGGVGVAYFKNIIAAPKYASGEWQDIHITLPTPSFLEKAAETAVDTGVIDAATGDVVQNVVDSASSAL